ncbi:hypothetical protein SLA2020_246910 [Shorea laevis]
MADLVAKMEEGQLCHSQVAKEYGNNAKVDKIEGREGDGGAGAGAEVEQQKGEVPPVEVKQKSKRVATLDAFRGLTIVLMILVDDAGSAYPRIDHSPWNGCTLADFVMPFFLFIVGVAIALALKVQSLTLNLVFLICI